MKRLLIAILLLLLYANLAHAQTACSVLPQTQLLNSFSDTAPNGSITPRNMRDFVCSSALQLSPLTSIGSSLYPIYQTSTTVNCSITNGSSAFACPANSAISVGDTVFPTVSADVPLNGGIWPTVATYTAGTGTGTFTVNATVTNASESLRFGSGTRFDATASTMVNTLMAQTGRFGDSSQNRTWWVDNNPGYTAGVTNSGPAVEIGPNTLGNSPYSLLVANRNSSGTGTNGHAIGLDILVRADANQLDFLGRRQNTWATYFQVEALNSSLNYSGSATAAEWEVANRWLVQPNDPYTRFPTINNQTTVLNLGCGAGEVATNSWGTLADCSSAIMVFANGAPFSNGITFDHLALDTSGGPASAIAMAGSQSLDWYSNSGHPAWRIYSVATDGVNQFQLILDNSLATMEFGQAADFTVQSDGNLQARIVVNAHAGTQNATIQFNDADVNKWQVGNLGGSDSFSIWDQTHAVNAFLINSSGAMTLGETSTVTNIQGSVVDVISPTKVADTSANPLTVAVAGFTPFDSASWNNSFVRNGKVLSSTGNQFGVYSETTVAAASGGAADYEKGALFGSCILNDISGAHLYDCVGADLRSYISATNTLGRAWGSVQEAIINAGGNGILVGTELDIVNNGTDQAAVNTTTSKYGLQIVAEGSNDTTAGIFGQSSSRKFHNFIYADPSTITSGGYFINFPGAFTVDGSGNISGAGYKVGATAGVNCPAGVTAATVVVLNGIVTHC